MNKIGTAHVLLSDSIHTLPIEEEKMVAAAYVSHGRQRESVYCPRRWYFCAWRRLPGSRSETVEDDAGEEASCTMTMVDRLQCGVRGRR